MLFVFGASKDLEQDEKEEAKAMFKSSLDDLMLIGLGSVFDVFGKSYLAFLFCADVTTEIIGYISQGDDSDEPLPAMTKGGEAVDPRVLRCEHTMRFL